MAPHPDALAPAPLDPAGHGVPLKHNLPDRSGGTRAATSRAPDLGLLGQKIVLAGMSNMTAALFTNPFDLIKVRQQLQLKTLTSSGQTSTKSTNWFRTLVNMVRAEGIGSVYKGLSASMLREASYRCAALAFGFSVIWLTLPSLTNSGIRMGGYDLVKSSFISSFPLSDPNGFGTKLAAGMVSGMIGAAVANPADLVHRTLFPFLSLSVLIQLLSTQLKVRMQSLSATGTLRDHASTIINTQGVRGFYRAVLPTTLRAGILTASQLGCYDHTKHVLKTDFPNTFREGMPTHLVASAIAGFCCSAASNPIDVVKVRLMSDKTSQYRNAVHCAAMLLKDEGPRAFYKGFTMCFLRLWPHSIVSLLVFEQLRRGLGMAPI
ncbi:SPOSA6832_00734 [Sporobolomyces salmonicolor]|uniref:SPOSA6832_00734-mRNA-1:cds n=1 Tax=Sporidiobolus salmonicolor TaxID=5005 RepID=A0A0D6EHH7_SPOSA|nr:SPOSA6832_00734 [Sporobolomyces salmonicolor]